MGYRRFPENYPESEDRYKQDKHQWEEGWVCPQCGLTRGKDLHDPCLGKLPGVKYACCGHGGRCSGSPDGYIAFNNGTVVRFTRLIKVEK